ncbi:hypothetical protein HD554DRAFT_625955 [Boletus coccyginus]|nr:hypothetical protein HD554DRAFT_625955 [Boletus coccyginus]
MALGPALGRAAARGLSASLPRLWAAMRGTSFRSKGRSPLTSVTTELVPILGDTRSLVQTDCSHCELGIPFFRIRFQWFQCFPERCPFLDPLSPSPNLLPLPTSTSLHVLDLNTQAVPYLPTRRLSGNGQYVQVVRTVDCVGGRGAEIVSTIDAFWGKGDDVDGMDAEN